MKMRSYQSLAATMKRIENTNFLADIYSVFLNQTEIFEDTCTIIGTHSVILEPFRITFQVTMIAPHIANSASHSYLSFPVITSLIQPVTNH